MVKFTKLYVQPNKGQNTNEILVDDETSQEYFVNYSNLQIEAHIESMVIQEIYLKISTSHVKNIQYQIYTLDSLDRECSISKGRLFKRSKDKYCDIFYQQLLTKTPTNRIRITIQNDQCDSFKIYFFDLKGEIKPIDHQKGQIEIEEQQKKNNYDKPKIIFQLARNQHPETKANMPQQFEDFIDKVKQGRSISNTQEERFDQDNVIIKKKVQGDNQTIQQQVQSTQEQKKISYIEIEDESSAQLLTEQYIKHYRENTNNKHFSQLQGCFTEQKQSHQLSQPTQQIQKIQPKTYFSLKNNEEITIDNFNLTKMIRYKSNEINQDFLEINKAGKLVCSRKIWVNQQIEYQLLKLIISQFCQLPNKYQISTQLFLEYLNENYSDNQRIQRNKAPPKFLNGIGFVIF